MKKQIIRFDVELSDQDMEKLDVMLETSYRSRKNFIEALLLVAVRSEGTLIDLTKLGGIK